MSESAETQIARLEERLKTIFELLERSNRDQNAIKEWMNQTNLALNKIDSRVKGVEDSLAKASPTIEEFITIKHKVVGAGIMGKWIWGGAGMLLGVLGTMRESIIMWVSK